MTYSTARDFDKNMPQNKIWYSYWHGIILRKSIKTTGTPAYWGYSRRHMITHTIYPYHDVIMSAMASQIVSLTIVYSTVYSGTDQRKHQSSALLAFVWRIHRWTVTSPHKGPITRKMFPFDDVIMQFILDPKSKQDKVKVTKLKDLPKFPIFHWKKKHATHLKLLDKKRKYEIYPASIVNDTVDTILSTDRRTDKVKLVYPFQLRRAGL